MRFRQFINEDYDEHFDEAKFEKDCQFYLEQMKGVRFLLHGTNSPVIPGKKFAFTPRTKPRDSRKSMHDKANKFFEEKFGLPFRNGLFVTGNQDVAKEYGKHTAIIVPVGKFEWISSPDITDLYQIFEKNSEKAMDIAYGSDDPDEYSDEWQGNYAEEETIKFLQKARWIHNIDLPKCVSAFNETILWCPNGFYTFTLIKSPSILLAK